MRLNKYLAKSGVASRRESDQLIQEATTLVNGILQTDPAFEVNLKDEIIFNGRRITIDQTTRVIMLNKPKGVVTTREDPHHRKTVMDLVPHKPRLFTIGRLDRNTTGLLLFTNDGDLAQALMLPKNKVSRIYHVEIDRPLNQDDKLKIAKGIYIGRGQKGKAKVLKQITHKKRSMITLMLQQGKNREIRRIMNTLNRKIISLHRTSYGPVELKGLSSGKWRTLSDKELSDLQRTLKK